MNKRIAHVITGLETGGAERSLFNLLQSGLQQRYDNHVISLSGMGHYGALLTQAGVPVYTLGLGEGAGLFGSYRKLRTLIARLSPAIVQGWMYHGNMAATAASIAMGPKPAVSWNIRQSLDALELEKRGTRLTIRALSPMSRTARAIIYNSHRSREQHEAFGYAAGRSLVIPNGFDTERWRPDQGRRETWRNRMGWSSTDIVLGYVGRFHPMKDIPTFLRACDAALGANPSLRVVMVGEGLTDQNAEIVDAIPADKRDRFRFLGRQSAVEDILPAFDIFCLSSSRNEGFPNVLGEAMASAIPCVATDVGDCARLLSGYGPIVQPGNASQMADAIGEIARLDAVRRAEIGKAARARIVAGYGLDATVDAYAGLYDSMMKRDD